MIPEKKGADRDFRIFLWFIIMLIALATIILLGIAGNP